MSDNENLLGELTGALKSDLIHSLQAKGRNATGKTIAALETPTTDSRSQLLGPWYIQILEDGRKPTPAGAEPSDPTLYDRIKEWCAAKGITTDAAWAITQKIHREGYAGKAGVISEPLSDSNLNRRTDEVLNKLAAIVQTEIANSLTI